MKWYEKVMAVCAVLVLLAVGFAVGRLCPLKSPVTPPEAKVDTLYVHDTIPGKPEVIWRRVKDTILVPVCIRDTAMIRDTILVPMEREEAEWRDSLCAVYASGIQVQVDSVSHYITKEIITKEIPYQVMKKTRWGLGVQVGGGVTIAGGKVCAGPYVGVGVSYNILSW